MNAEPMTDMNTTSGSAPMATEEESLNSSTTADEDDHLNNDEESSASTPQLDQSIRSGTPQANLLKPSASNLKIYQELDDAFLSLDHELKELNKEETRTTNL